MNQNAAFVLLLATTCLSVAFAQNAVGVNWSQVQPIHETSGFFDDYPVMRQIFGRQTPLTSVLEGGSTTRNQFPYQVSHKHTLLCNDERLYLNCVFLFRSAWSSTEMENLATVVDH